MKIISHGNRVKPEKLTFECSFCGCRWEASRDEFTMEEAVYGLMKSHWIIYRCTCPECDRETTLETPKDRSKYSFIF